MPQITLLPGVEPQGIDAGTGSTVTVSGATVYYADNPGVTSASYEGSIASGGSATLYGTQFLVVAKTGNRADVLINRSTAAASTNDARNQLKVVAQGLGGETFSRQTLAGSTAPTAGEQRATMIGLLRGDIITNIYAHVTVAGSSITLAKMQLWNTSGTLLGNTADVASQFTSGTGPKGGALTTPYEVPTDGAYYIGAVWVGGTVATLARGTGGLTGYTGQVVGSGLPAGVNNTSKTDAGDLTISANGTCFWFGWT